MTKPLRSRMNSSFNPQNLNTPFETSQIRASWQQALKGTDQILTAIEIDKEIKS